MAATVYFKSNRKCRVPLCELDHEEHFCRLCERQDSDHFSSECPKSKTLYHGTQIKCLKPISTQGLNPSKDGRLGKGIYFVKEYNQAENISRERNDPNDKPNSVVIECKVHLGRHYNCNVDSDKYNDTWQKEFDSASTMHPPWCCLLYTSPSPRDGLLARMPSSA